MPANVNHKERWVGQTRTCNDSCEPHWAGLRGELRAHVARIKRTFQPLSGANDVGHFVLIMCHLHQKSPARSAVKYNEIICETPPYTKGIWGAVHRDKTTECKLKNNTNNEITYTQISNDIKLSLTDILKFLLLKIYFSQIQLWFSCKHVLKEHWMKRKKYMVKSTKRKLCILESYWLAVLSYKYT